ncbi:MAG TPA: alpha/beta hydrolase [Bacteroidales bacterium]|nr:alpha/beta hydrolase [Bacteroidales bacterium]HNZ43237.1 alpha/beta hydrolase [Bacteroidales bacterium]HPB25949.1 alpha/beta hydrolase [Bacteroidales bacterium]HPI30763.1 alpha/beta hydrolase [Bacteroidales bacterium]HQP16253.1 alpha/beta hydrolase [Bacteroidales bacterium]
MKKTLFIILLSIVTFSGFSQTHALHVAGNWLGSLDVGVAKLRIGLMIKDSSGILISKLISPDQGAMNIKVDKAEFANDTLKIVSKEIHASFKGTINISADTLKGFFTQGKKFPLSMARVEKLPELNRPQEPQRPFPYKEEEVTFINKKAGISLSGTLTLPSSGENFTAVVMVSGSGPQNRDEELLGHKPFLVISDYLTRNGIAVLRYDDRGTGKSKGIFSTATTADFADDAEAAFTFLQKDKRINPEQIGIMGHSEGGLIAPVVASRNNDVTFIVMLAGPGLKGEDILLLQSELIARADSTPEEEIATNKELNKKLYKIAKKEKDDKKATEKMRKLIDDYWKTISPDAIKNSGIDKQVLIQSVYQVVTPWFRYFISYDPGKTLSKITCPVLAMNGSKDLQVPSAQNLKAIEKYLLKAGNKDFTIKEFEGLNHLFQHSATGSPSEYVDIEETFSPEVLEYMTQWLNKLSSK